MFFYILSEHSQEECLLSVMPLRKKITTHLSESQYTGNSYYRKGQLETHMSSPHIPSALGERGERQRGWWTKEIVRKERKCGGESKTLELILRTGEKRRTSVKNRSPFYLLVLSIDMKSTLRSQTPHRHVPLDILAHVNTYSLWTPLKL